MLNEHRSMALAVAANYFIPGADRDDVRQEAMVGLLLAARTYDGSTPFASFAAMVVHRWLQTCVKAAHRDKHRPVLEAWRVGWDPETDVAFPIVELLEDPVTDEQRATVRAELGALVKAFRRLSPLERRALLAVVNDEHPHRGGVDKQVDNAACRARRKLRRAV